jgi:hypothetical protein
MWLAEKNFLTPSGKIELISFREFIENIEEHKIELFFSQQNLENELGKEEGLEDKEQEYP